MHSKYVKKWTNNKPCFVNFRNIRQYDTVCVLINDEAEKNNYIEGIHVL